MLTALGETSEDSQASEQLNCAHGCQIRAKTLLGVKLGTTDVTFLQRIWIYFVHVPKI